MSTLYPSDLSDDEWKHLQQSLPAEPSSGRPRTHTLRAIGHAIFYVLKTGCPWRYLPSNFPPGSRYPSTFDAGVSKATGIDFSRLFERQNASEWAATQNPAQPSSIPKARRPSRSQRASLALIPTSIAKGASSICSLTL